MRDLRRPALIAFASVLLLGVVGLLVIAGLDQRRLAFTLGVQPTQVAAALQPGDTACQGPIDVPADARTVRFPAGSSESPGGELQVFTRTARGVTGADSVPVGIGGPTTVSASPGGIVAGRRIELCARNAGRREVTLYGGAPPASRTSTLEVNAGEVGSDLTLVFERAESRSLLSAAGDVFERAALFRPSWVSTGLLWVLAALLLTSLPAALLLALRSAVADAPSRGGDGPGLPSD